MTNIHRITQAIAVAIILVAPSHFVSAQEGDPSVSTLVKRLGSEDFTQRQTASKLLFEKGPAIVAELKTVALSSNPELNQRVRVLIALLSVDSDAIQSREVFDAVLKFEDAEMETRKQLLKQLLNSEQYEMYFELVNQLTDNEAEEVFSENRVRYLIPVLCEKGHWDEVDMILSQHITWKHESELCGLYHQTMGTLDVWIDKMKHEIDEAEFVDTTQLTTLIGLLKAQKRYDVAFRYAQKFSSFDVVNYYENQILMDSGDWKTLAGRAVLGDVPVNAERYFLCDELTYPLVKYWGGTEKEFRDAMEEIGRAAEDDEEDVFGDEEDEIPLDVDSDLQAVQILTLDWQEARKNIPIAKDPGSIVLLKFWDEYDLLFKTFELGSDFEGHRKWADAEIEAINGLAKQYTLSVIRGNANRRSQLTDDVEREMGLFLDVCDLLAELGLEEEATLFIRQLHEKNSGIKEMAPYHSELIGRVADYGDAAALWDFIENAGLSKNEVKMLVLEQRPLGGSGDNPYPLFGSKHLVAQFVWRKLEGKIEDPIELLKHVAHVVNYQLKPTFSDDEIVSVDADVAMIEHSFSSDECWIFSQIFTYHQRPEYKQWRAMAATDGDPRAIKGIAAELFEEGKYEAAAEMFEQVYERTKNPLPLSLAAEAAGKAGDALREKQLKFRAYIVPLFIYDNSYSDTYGPYSEEERSDLIADRLLFRISTADSTDKRFLVHYGIDIFEDYDPVAASNFSKMSLLSNSKDVPPLYLMDRALKSGTLDATSSVLKGEYETAAKIVDRLLKCRPADPSISEKTVSQLNLAGQEEVGSRMIDQLSDIYHKLLVKYPDSATHCNNYAWALACAQRHTDSAIRHAKIAVKMRPQNAGFVDTLAESYFAAGDIDTAVETMNHAVSIEPEKAYYRKQLRKYKAAKEQ